MQIYVWLFNGCHQVDTLHNLPLTNSSLSTFLHNLADINFTVIISKDLGVYQPYYNLKRTLVAMSERTGLSISQVTDEVLYSGLIEMQELDELEEWRVGRLNR